MRRAAFMVVVPLLAGLHCSTFGAASDDVPPAEKADGETADSATADGSTTLGDGAMNGGQDSALTPGAPTTGVGVRCEAGGTAVRCSGATPRCCLTASSASCVPMNVACMGYPMDCDETSDCPQGVLGDPICCYRTGGATCDSTANCVTALCDPSSAAPCPSFYGTCKGQSALAGYRQCTL